jgi:hypothetical protein
MSRCLIVLSWYSNCPWKALWLWFLLALCFWDWTYLGTYDDHYGDEAALATRDKDGDIVWKYIPPTGPYDSARWLILHDMYFKQSRSTRCGDTCRCTIPPTTPTSPRQRAISMTKSRGIGRLTCPSKTLRSAWHTSTRSTTRYTFIG